MSDSTRSDDDVSQVEDKVRALLDVLRQAPDPQAALAQAGALREVLKGLESEAAQVRAELAHRIWHDERLTLAQLATRMGVSVGRAGQLVQSGKAINKEKLQ